MAKETYTTCPVVAPAGPCSPKLRCLLGPSTPALHEFRDLAQVLSLRALFSHIQACHPVHLGQGWLDGTLHIAERAGTPPLPKP